MTRELLTTAEVARITGVTPSAVSRWVQRGRLTPVARTPGGHLRFDAAEARGLGKADGKLMTLSQVAAAFQADPRTIARWSDAGLLPCTRTAGGSRRFDPGDVNALLRKQGYPEVRQGAGS